MSTRQLDRILAAVNASERYYFPLTDGVPDFRVVVCRDCSSRTTGVQIPSDEIVEHDAWHAEEPSCCDGTGWTGNPRTPCAEHYVTSGDVL